jgi:amino acid adenylation domain-containing protein/non-ribosomal peptide synthase protein (TIGR01720 family)
MSNDPSDLFQLIATELSDPARLMELMQAPPAERPASEAAPYVATRTATEETLAALWADLLRVERVGAEDNFFTLGGHSLLGTQMLSRVADATAVELPLRALFDAPTVAGLAREIDAAPIVSRPDLARKSRETAPLSSSQQRLWLIQQLAPEDPSYTIPVAFRVRGPLDEDALERAFAEIVRRHEVLRTTFAVVDGSPVQRVGPVPVPVLTRIDAASEVEARDAMAAELRRPFDLETGPIFRARLWRTGPDERLLLFAVHHIAFDGWSAGVLLRELAALYGGSSLPAPRLQYADYAAWQRDWMESGEMRAQLDFWRERLGGAEPEALELPADRPRPAVRTFRGSRERVLLPAALIDRLRRLAEAEGATLFMALLAGFEALLHRYTGRDDLWIGTPVANRSRLETEDLLGFFVNTLILRTDLSGDPDFRTLLARVREVTLAAYDRQDLPLDRLVEELRPERSLGYQPLFQVLFALQNTPRAMLNPSGLELEPLPVHNGTSRFDLVVSLEEGETGLTAVIESSADLFDRPTVLRLAGHLAAVLESAAADPDRPLSGLGLMTGVERHQTFVEWNDSGAEYPRNGLVHELLEAQAARTPDIPALVLNGEAWIYADLNRRANRIAHHLRRLGAVPEARVAILVERSFDVVAAIFGVLKSGAAYVPLDPGYPAERLAYILEDSRPVALVTRTALVRDLPLPEGLRIVDLDAVEGSDDDPERVAVPENLAYAIYTSGSTGQPKGVLVPHRGVVSLAAMMAAVFGLGPGSRILQLFSFGFDASMWDLLMALPVGGTLHVAPEEVRLPGAPLERLLREERIEVVTLPPSLLSVLPAAELPDVRIVTATGEACSAEVVAQWAPGRRFYNGYGPTETTVGTTMGLCEGGERVPSIGRPFTNTRVYLLDRAGAPVPVGVPGELLAGGDGVARGYLGQPALTAERFVPDPFGEPAGRLYRTGDLARYRPDGRLEFLGRVDHQVKIRGFRVELEEIESRLARHPEVGDAVVVAREEGGGPRRLVAYVKLTGLEETGRLRSWLKESLPDFMIPSAFVSVNDFPRLPNGKVDRRLLARTAPPPEARSEKDVAAPRTRAEEILVRVWSEVLGAARVGVHDNFFELGGDSILSIQVVARAQRAGLKLSPRQVFLHQTVSELAAVAVEETGTGDEGPVTGPVTPLPIQRWFFEQDLPAPHHWNHAVMLAAQRPVDPARLRAACAALHERHDALRLRAEDGRMWIAGPDEPLPFTVVDGGLLSEAAAQVQTGLDLAAGPIVRFVLFLNGEAQARLLLVIHHLAVDGVSWRILLADLHAAYEGLELAPRGTSFQSWAAKLAEHARTPAVLDELPFWAERPSVPPLPVDFPGRNAGNTEGSAETLRVSLSEKETRPLLQEVDTQAALLAALARAFAPWTGEDRLLVDLEGHGREEELFENVDLTRTVGWFTSLFPVLLPEPRRVSRQGIGYGLLRYLAGGEASASLAGLPRAEVSFNYLGQLDRLIPGSSAFVPASDPSGPLRDPRGMRSHRIDVNVSVSGGRLHASLTYSRNVHRRETIEALAGRFAEALRSGDQGPAAPAYSVADFPRVRMSQDELDDILDDLIDPDAPDEDFA